MKLFSSTRRMIHSMKAFWERPLPGRVYFSDPNIDALMGFMAENLTRSKLKAKLLTADNGELNEALELFEEMEWRDLSLGSVARTRRNALTALDWEVVSAAEVDEAADRRLADEAADFAKSELTKLESFKRGLKHLARAVGDNLAVAELVWEGNRIVEINPVPPRRLRMDSQTPGVIRVVTAKEHSPGIAADGPKWVTHIPEGSRDRPLVSSIARASTLPFLVGQVALLNWARFVEIFGMPVRIARYQPNATGDEKKEIAKMMENLGARAWGVFSQSMNIEFIESSQRGTAPYDALINACSRSIAKLWLGGNLVADTTGGTGTFAAADVQNEVREDLRDDDIANEGNMVRRQIIAPMVGFEFWRSDIPLPFFTRVKPETVDRVVIADLFTKAQQAGVKVPLKFAHDRLGIPEPQDGEAVLTPQLDAFGEGLGETGFT